jgi:hypothetical protein
MIKAMALASSGISDSFFFRWTAKASIDYLGRRSFARARASWRE